ncbi:MAG TPA: methyltransferase domain-containing protein [Candidatus Absconditabacterales bacterium]|nr:methyltransferase domain-containing protein [Candidatus Absconditabacterales bacterium]HOQ79348.1 methyltransferase domain-containing protein [Candidatus Absconditabacterales bacterium]HPK28007.1 methyltransferase domain-containing protein [Candidatus Absconditabacterales bacterium]
MSQKDFYNNNVKKFSIYKSTYNQTNEHTQQFIFNLIGTHKHKIILDYGCGNGGISYLHAKAGAKLVLGVDISKKLIANAIKTKQNINSLHFLTIDDKNLYFDKVIKDGIFDIITSYLVFCCIKDEKLLNSIIKSFYYKLKKGGKVYIQLPNIEDFNGKESYSFYIIKENNLQEGKETFAYLRTNGKAFPKGLNNSSEHLKIINYFWSKKKLKEMFINQGFKNVEIYNIKVENSEYDGIVDEKNYSPLFVLTATK